MNKPLDARASRPSRATYEGDLHAWAQEQAALLRAGRLPEVDAANIAEELEDVGREQYDRLESALRVLLTHILKWDHQSERRSRSWAATITVQRRHAQKTLGKNPSLKPRLAEALADAYADARLEASGETNLPLRTFPAELPYDWAAIIDRPFAIDPDDAG
jgi:Domain of unknown function DUF29